MSCVHLRKLYDLCRENNIKLAGADLIHIVCTECGEKEVCPATMMDELGGTDEDEPTPHQPPSGSPTK